MMLFILLPQEVILQVFQCLEPAESRSLIDLLKTDLPNSNAQRAINLLYARLYLGHTVLGAGGKAPRGYNVSITPSQVLELARDSNFLANVPKELDMTFVRDVRDYINFQQNLADLREILKSDWAPKYLSKVQLLSLKINGRSITTENPTLMPALVLSTLIELTRHSSANFRSIRLKSADIGDLLPHKWGKVLGGFVLVQELSLEDNKLRLELVVGHESLLERYFDWPPQLRVLSLSRNYLQHFRVGAFNKLPQTLEVLDLSQNLLECIGLPYDQTFTLVDKLPKLRILNLSLNSHLVLVDPNLFVGANELEVSIEGCNVCDGHLEMLVQSANRNGVRLVTDLA